MDKVNVRQSWFRGSCIGKGSFGTVSLAVNKFDGHVFAVKSVNQSLCLSSQMDAIENEIQILRTLSSPHVVEYLGDDVTCESPTTSYRNLHLEYLPRGTVADSDVDEITLRSYTWCVLSALRYLHSRGIVHCDVKGKNVMVGPTPGTSKLADFGSATKFTAVMSPRGSPLWMAPEVVRQEYQGPESDVWSVGCTVIEMATGKPAWEDRGADTLCQIGYSCELPEFPTQLSELGRDFLEKCLRREHSERWSCDQLLLHPFISSCSPPNIITDWSPRCILDWFDSNDFSDGDEEQTYEIENLNSNSKERIKDLASNAGAIWESDGWLVVRNLISKSEEGEGTSSAYPDLIRTEEKIVGTSSEYSNSISQCTNWEYLLDSSGNPSHNTGCSDHGWGGVGAGSSCRYGLGKRDWAVESGEENIHSYCKFVLLLYFILYCYDSDYRCNAYIFFFAERCNAYLH